MFGACETSNATHINKDENIVFSLNIKNMAIISPHWRWGILWLVCPFKTSSNDFDLFLNQ